MLQSMGSQRLGQDWAAEQQQQREAKGRSMSSSPDEDVGQCRRAFIEDKGTA